jgi:hypothetical protein
MMPNLGTMYISGPMAGLPNFNCEAFDEAEYFLKAMGYKVYTPANVGRHDRNLTYEEKLRKVLRLMLKCENIYFLKGWEFSFGARLEMQIALALKMDITYEVDPCLTT